MNLSNITNTPVYNHKVEVVTIFPPGWADDIKKFKEENWQNKRLLRNICKYQDTFWNYMKENKIIPKNIVNEIEKTKDIDDKWFYSGCYDYFNKGVESNVKKSN